MIESIIWLLILQLIGLLTLPLSFTFFRFLPERGYSFSKPLGLLVFSFVVWFAGMLGLPVTPLTGWVFLAIVLGGSGLWLMLRDGQRLWLEMQEWFVRNRWLVLVVEILFIAAYFYLVNLRSFMPEIRDQEKFGDHAFMNSMALHSKLPPEDPWMSGYTINYYYFSHFQVALLTKLSGIAPSITFNLSTPMVFGFLALGCFGVVYNLVAFARGRGGSTPVFAGLAASLFVSVMGNLDTVRQLVAPRGSIEGERDPGGSFFFSWWSPSRVIYDYMPNNSGGTVTYEWRETINEFPMFSFLLADMHPHVMALPFVLLVIGAALNIFMAPVGSGILSLRGVKNNLNFFLLALCAGSLYFLNTWDYPTFTLLILGAALVREIWRGGEEVEERTKMSPGDYFRIALLGGNVPSGAFWPRFWRVTGFSARLVIVSLLLFTPFHLTFKSLVGESYLPEPVKSIPIISTIGRLFGAVAWDRTPLFGYILVFGVFLFPLVSFLLIKFWAHLKEPYAYLPESVVDEKVEPLALRDFYPLAPGLVFFGLAELVYFANISVAFSLVLGLASAPILAIGAGMVAARWLESIRPGRPGRDLQLIIFILAALMTLMGWMVRFELYGPLVMAVVIAGLLLWFERNEPLKIADGFVLGLIILSGTINWVIEVIYLRDIFESRFNTIFKFYYQTWLLYGLAAAYASWRVITLLWRLAPETQIEEGEKPAKPATAPYQPAPRPVISQLRLQAAGSNIVFSAGSSFSSGNITPEDLEEFSRREERRFPRWRWFWGLALMALVLGGMAYPLLGPYEKSGKFANREGLDGEAWVQQNYTADYNAIKWLREQAAAEPDFEGVVLEAEGGDWINYSRVATFSGFPTVLGWYYHEAQWRGGDPKALAEVRQRYADINTIYNTTDIEEARRLLAKYKVKYVFVGQIETNAASASLYSSSFKDYKPEGLAKFARFMQPVYQKDGVTIYKFQQ